METYPCYSFQPDDCEKYRLRYASAIYWPTEIPKADIVADVVFIGTAIPGRIEQLRKLREDFQIDGLQAMMHIVLPQHIQGDEEMAPDWCMTRHYASYETYLSWMARSRAILELNQSEQTGFSQRTLEALFYVKKLITNNHTVMDADFYHPNNAFVLGHDDNLKAWMETPSTPVPEDVRDYYRVDNWARRIYENA